MSICLQTGNETAFFPSPIPTEDGHNLHLTMKVGLVDLTSNSDEINGNPSLHKEYAADHGILALPESYTPDGTPTRLIIFTHGSAVYYKSSINLLNVNDINTEYWLSEGYAIMDMDGTMTGSSDEDSILNKQYGVSVDDDGTKYGSNNVTINRSHFYEPSALQSYVTAYRWIISHFNIKTDGVFSIGRSMGGGMQFVLAKSSTIPIIASAAIVPSVSPLGYFSAPVSAQTRQDLFNVLVSSITAVFSPQMLKNIIKRKMGFIIIEIITQKQI